MGIGPALPPHLAHLVGGPSSPEQEDQAGPSIPRSTTPPLEDEDEDAYGPALPPHLVAARQNGKPLSSSVAGRQAGPSLPAGPSRPSPPPIRPSRPSAPSHFTPDYPGEDDDDDDVVGPMPVPQAATAERSAVQEFMEREERWAKEREEAAKPKKLQREEWMLVPPTSGVLSSVDPLRKRPTTFSRSTAQPTDIDSSVWTETPQEKAQRIADDVAGVKRAKKHPRPGEGEDPEEVAARWRRDTNIRDGVDRHTVEKRGESLLDRHKKKKLDKEDDTIWDHDKMMGITGRLMSDQERGEKIKEAKGLNDRFGHSKRGAFDI